MSDNKITSIKVDRDTCIGAAPCVAVAATLFELDDEQKAVMLKKGDEKTSDMTNVADLAAEGMDDATLTAAAESCPVRAIFLYDAEGNQVFPE
ncbi:MAG: ferredoxin [Patescibacteria group bacterium]|nr:ferredoxin [Patescibacteria group bacterium]